MSTSVSNVVEKMPGVFKELLHGLALTVWAAVIILSALIWFTTVYYADHGIEQTIEFIAAPFIVFFTFVLEGIETAYTELREKDRQQFADPSVTRLFDRIRHMKEEAFFEAREWAIVALLVAATLMIDKSEYYVPFIAHVTEESQPTAVTIIRLGLTIALTFALVWLAQSPGKHVARKNSVNFLSHWSSQITFSVLRVIWRFLSFLGVQYPSEKTDAFALEVMPQCKEERNLLPSEFSFFADGLKKYGYGFLISDDELNVQEKGACEIVSKALFYVGMPRPGVKRLFAFEEGFADGTVENLKMMDSSHPDFKCWAFEAPLIGEKVTETQLNDWADLFYSKNPSNWARPAYNPISTKLFTFTPDLISPKTPSSGTGKDRDLHLLEVELNFRQRLPKEAFEKEDQKALVILWEIRVSTKHGTFPLPSQWRERTEYRLLQAQFASILALDYHGEPAKRTSKGRDFCGFRESRQLRGYV